MSRPPGAARVRQSVQPTPESNLGPSALPDPANSLLGFFGNHPRFSNQQRVPVRLDQTQTATQTRHGGRLSGIQISKSYASDLVVILNDHKIVCGHFKMITRYHVISCGHFQNDYKIVYDHFKMTTRYHDHPLQWLQPPLVNCTVTL